MGEAQQTEAFPNKVTRLADDGTTVLEKKTDKNESKSFLAFSVPQVFHPVREGMLKCWRKFENEPAIVRFVALSTLLASVCGIGCFVVLLLMFSTFVFIWISLITAATLVGVSWVMLVLVASACGISAIALPIAGFVLLSISCCSAVMLLLVLGFRNKNEVLDFSYKLKKVSRLCFDTPHEA
uniref:Uncharacterized protein n=1 Tax=Lotharella oceanica TaxID=641309 RepID=A0A7S2TP06_9EUKA